ncbi:MAG TPA: hypothetical protein VHE58_00715 [Burkholderiales bacterium]|nr:hypothetical protein [Burkholderiales bacterium]
MATSESVVIELTKPVLLEFAKAVYICQCFESSLCFLLSLMAHEKIPEEGALSASWDFHSKKTLGQLLHRLSEQIEVPPKLDEYLGIGVEKRNEIIHGFLTKNVMRLAAPKGRIEIEKELVELKWAVKKRDIVVNKLIDALLAKYGLSNEMLEWNADRYWEYMNPQEGDDLQKHKH